MLELLDNLPDNVVGVRASGWVSAHDYTSVLIPAVDAAIARHAKVRVLYQVGPEFLGFTPGAVWDDMKLGLSHYRDWEKVAVVTDVTWIAMAMQAFFFAMPCPTKVFSVAEQSQAVDWLVED